jgi:hypothetical protein
MTIAREEIFGPVLSVIDYDTEDEAISIANDSKYGLHAGVIGADLGRAHRVASQLRAGRVVINGMIDDPQARWFQILRYRPGIWSLRHRGVSRNPRHPRGLSTVRMSRYVAISPQEAADRLAIRELVEAYAHCADRRNAKGQIALFTADTHLWCT